jgi:hypothetical protein
MDVWQINFSKSGSKTFIIEHRRSLPDSSGFEISGVCGLSKWYGFGRFTRNALCAFPAAFDAVVKMISHPFTK